MNSNPHTRDLNSVSQKKQKTTKKNPANHAKPVHALVLQRFKALDRDKHLRTDKAVSDCLLALQLKQVFDGGEENLAPITFTPGEQEIKRTRQTTGSRHSEIVELEEVASLKSRTRPGTHFRSVQWQHFLTGQLPISEDCVKL